MAVLWDKESEKQGADLDPNHSTELASQQQSRGSGPTERVFLLNAPEILSLLCGNYWLVYEATNIDPPQT